MYWYKMIKYKIVRGGVYMAYYLLPMAYHPNFCYLP